ncbi:MAG: 2-hydroxycyclohexanecarboxyl-CoA dehydrogenase [Gammaproteobacteria bacterium]|nr:MAG: 2-hydroxycyclohexanecarboxyl-CoA dehydrogenase [Gammaproteobacteria bacterium]
MANTQQIALVTGGARGIGEAICRVLAKAGHRIIVTDISVQGAQDLAKQLDGHAYEMDVTNAESVNNAAEKINQEVGVPTILVNNAGWDNLMPFLETDEAFQDKVIAINYTGPVRVCRAFLPGMIEAGGGRIVNIASDAGRIGSALEAIYSGTKGGLIAFSKTLAREFARNQITVNTVCPGITNTPLIQEITANNELAGRGIASIEKNVPLKRMGQPEDIANAVAYLASEGAAYVTGQTLSVSGGISMAG